MTREEFITKMEKIEKNRQMGVIDDAMAQHQVIEALVPRLRERDKLAEGIANLLPESTQEFIAKLM